MKSNLIVLFIILSYQLSFSQTYRKRSNAEKATYYTQQMQQDIQLDSLQIPIVYAIQLAVSTKIDSLYASHPTPKQKSMAFKEIFSSRDEALKKVLTTKQFLQWDDVQRERRAAKLKVATSDSTHLLP